MCRSTNIMKVERWSPSPGMSTPSGAPQNMRTESPRTAVGNARGMSRSVSRKFFPLKFFLTIIQAMGRPAMMSKTVTTNARPNETPTALHMTDLLSESARTSLMPSQSVNICVTTYMDGTTMIQTKIATTSPNHALRAFALSDTLLILSRRDIGRPSEYILRESRYLPRCFRGGRRSRAFFPRSRVRSRPSLRETCS